MPNLQKIHAKKIVVIGDSSSAMTVSIALSLLGLNITLVGPRLGYYIRSGELNTAVFRAVNSAISPLTIAIPGLYGSSANYIRNLEKQLYTHVQNLGIPCIKKKFLTFIGNKQLKLVNKDDSNDTVIIEADLVFDCTGSLRIVTESVNQEAPLAPFQIKPVSHLSYDFAMARFDYSSLDQNTPLKEAKNNLTEEMLVLLKLRQLGWPYFILPAFYHFDWESANNKQNLYFQSHSNFSFNDLEKIACLLENQHYLKINDRKINSHNFFHAPSKKHPSKKVISNFKLAPRLTTPSFYMGDTSLPMIIPLGDALLDIPFLLADSLVNFTKILKLFTSSIVIENGVITSFDLDYEQLVSKQLESPLTKINELFLEMAEVNEQGSIHEDKLRIEERSKNSFS